jgi:hypothetical protein
VPGGIVPGGAVPGGAVPGGAVVPGGGCEHTICTPTQTIKQIRGNLMPCSVLCGMVGFQL